MRQRILSKPQTSVTALVAAMAAVLYLCLAALPVHAAEGFDFYTDSPGIHVTAGDALSFNLHLAGSNAAGSDVALSVASMPEGFTGFFKSGSYEVTKVHASGDGADTIATFQTTVPSDVADGVYEIVLHAASEGGFEDDLILTLTVSGLESGESNFHVEYPDQEGVSGTDVAAVGELQGHIGLLIRESVKGQAAVRSGQIQPVGAQDLHVQRRGQLLLAGCYRGSRPTAHKSRYRFPSYRIWCLR